MWEVNFSKLVLGNPRLLRTGTGETPIPRGQLPMLRRHVATGLSAQWAGELYAGVGGSPAAAVLQTIFANLIQQCFVTDFQKACGCFAVPVSVLQGFADRF